MPVEVVACPTVREPDGLALSSRNVRLSADRAPRPRGLCTGPCGAGRAASPRASASGAAVGAAMAAMVAAEPLVRLDYAAAVDAAHPEVPDGSTPGEVRLLVAARVGPVRLIDNCDALAAADEPRRRPRDEPGASSKGPGGARCDAA